MNEVQEAPNREYLEFNFVKETATGKGNNKQFVMEYIGSGMFKVTEGRIGIRIGKNKPRHSFHPMSEWDSLYIEKIRSGYMLTKQKKMERREVTKNSITNGTDAFKPITDEAVKQIVERLLGFAVQMIKDNYTVWLDDISDEMLLLGKQILDEMSEGYESVSVAEFNNKLKVLYAAIPRRIDNLSKNLAKRKAEIPEIINREKELYSIMVTQLRNIKTETESRTVLEAFGLDIRCCTDAESDMIKKMMGPEGKRFRQAWKVVNSKTETAFDSFCQGYNLSEGHGISHLFHGSRNENFWSIITNGLTIDPKGVPVTGKAFGIGTYFACDAIKSLGYTSRRGSKWAGGTSPSGFLLMCKVAVGTEDRHYIPACCDPSFKWHKLQKVKPGALCTWYHAGGEIGFRMDEIIIYQDMQSTPEYIIEVKA